LNARHIPCLIVEAYLIVVIARALLSWFPIRPGTAFASVYRVLIDLTEPIAGPLRRVIPPAGQFDLSYFVLAIVIYVVQQAVCSAVH
jgi:YggT family protein